MLSEALSAPGTTISIPLKRRGRAALAADQTASEFALPSAVSRAMPPAPSALIGLTREGLARFAVGDFQAAEQAFRVMSEIAPHEAMCWNNLALVLVAMGELDQAVPPLRRSLAIDSSQFAPWVNLASALLRLGRAAEAEAACAEALALDPVSAEAWQILAMSHVHAEDFSGAALAFARSIELAGETSALRLNLGAALLRCGRFEAAAASLGRAIDLDPASTVALEVKRMCDFIVAAIAGDVAKVRAIYPEDLFDSPEDAERVFRTAMLHLDRADQRQAAILVAEEWAGSHPQSVEAIHMRHAALSRSVERQPATLVAQAFDEIAEDFDDRLVRRLAYRGPERLAALIAQRIVAAGTLDVLDLGCGTGLCGPFLRPYARRLVGVDLSARMLAKAAERGLYDDLRVADLLGVLGQQSAHWDMLIAADTFPYLGDLAAVFDGALDALRPGGLFAFSTEAADSDGFVLKGTGRFAHGARYVQALAAGRFEILAHTAAVLRREAARPVDGGFYLLQRVDSRG